MRMTRLPSYASIKYLAILVANLLAEKATMHISSLKMASASMAEEGHVHIGIRTYTENF